MERYKNKEQEIIINEDASGDNRSTQSEYTNYAIMQRLLKENGYNNVKFRLRNYNPPVLNRIAAFNARVRSTDGKIRLFVDKKCKYLLENINNSRYIEETLLEKPL